MLDGPDYASLIAGQTRLMKMVNSGESGLLILDEGLQVAQDALGAAGMSFAECGPAGGRIVAATGAAQWALGRPVSSCHPRPVELPQKERADLLSEELAEQLRDRGVQATHGARVAMGGAVIGTLYAHYRDSTEGRPEHQAIMDYLAGGIAHLYGYRTGLPVRTDAQVVAALADGLAIVGADDVVRLWNRAAERLTGLSLATALDRPSPFPVPPPGQVTDHRLTDGRWLRITSGDLPGSIASRVVTFRDITDQYRREHDQELFLAVTGHELRTPVTVIKGYAQTLRDHWDSLTEDDRRHAAEVIGQRAGDLARLVERLLSSVNETGMAGVSEPEPFDLGEALRSAVADLPDDLRHRLVVDLPDDLPKALGDRVSVATVMIELVTNAEKYSASGAPVELGAAADEHTVVFRVSDRGIGVRPDHVERAFDRFWQAESGDRRRYPGAGLGLYLVRRMIERQNGWVSLRPRENGGTVAEVRLPRG